MAKISGHWLIQQIEKGKLSPDSLTRKQRKAIKQSNDAGRTSVGYGWKNVKPSNRSFVLPEDKWAEAIFL
jgi:hypothetical protein